MDTFKFLVTFLNEHNLRWWVAYGTIIGAVRHKGLIPWDDDIDIFMPRDDYMKLLSYKQEFKKASDGHYEIEHLLSNPEYGARFAKAMDMTTTIQAQDYIPSIMGVFVDIFPLESSNATKDAILKTKAKVYSAWTDYFDYVKHFPFSDFWRNTSLKQLYKKIKTNCKSNQIKKKDALKRALSSEKDASDSNFGEGKYCFCLYGAYREKDIYLAEWFKGNKEVEFEDMLVKIPSGYHEMLTQIYGDYMTPPPISKCIPRHLPYYVNLKERLTLDEVKHRVKYGETVQY